MKKSRPSQLPFAHRGPDPRLFLSFPLSFLFSIFPFLFYSLIGPGPTGFVEELRNARPAFPFLSRAHKPACPSHLIVTCNAHDPGPLSSFFIFLVPRKMRTRETGHFPFLLLQPFIFPHRNVWPLFSPFAFIWLLFHVPHAHNQSFSLSSLRLPLQFFCNQRNLKNRGLPFPFIFLPITAFLLHLRPSIPDLAVTNKGIRGMNSPLI